LEKLVQYGELHPRAGIVNGHNRLFYDQLSLILQSDTFQPEGDSRQLGVQVFGIDSGTRRGVCQFLDGFYRWEETPHSRFRWTAGKAVIGVPVPSGCDNWILHLTLCAPRPVGSPVHVGLLLGDELLEDWTLTGQDIQDCEVTLPNQFRFLAKPLVQNAGSSVNRDGYGQDRGTFVANNEMFFEVDQNQYPDGLIAVGCAANMLLRRAMLDEIGGFDDRFFMYYEDTDLSWRAWLRGWEVHYTHEAIIRHIHCGTTQEWSPFFVFLTERNRLAMLLKNGSFRQVIRNWSRYALGVSRQTLGFLKAILFPISNRRAMLRRLFIHYKVLLSLLIWIPALFWQRAKIRRNRCVIPAEIWQSLAG
jgi:hypothetical protein